ncbi:MAG: hypothetical protein BGO76_07110 [Caedibacter sp. 38-128]|nr:ATP-grasp domain-containing protein [Holosporales bacterium]OJX04781.1 MAG: hypothetical protein BGO76_07110 [Caedibacter sp. 38-128]
MKLYLYILNVLFLTTSFAKGSALLSEHREEPKNDKCLVIVADGNLALYEQTLNDISSPKILVCAQSALSETVKTPLHLQYKKIIPIEDYFTSGAVELALYKISKEDEIDRIIATSETDILRIGHVRSYLNLRGQNYESALAFRDKVRMKKILQEQGISVPRFSSINCSLELIQFTEKHGFPVIIKPKRGYGASHMTILRSQSELEAFIKKSQIFDEFHKTSLEVEGFITGNMYHVDGIIRNKKPLLMWPSAYINQCIDMVFGKHVGSYLLTEDDRMYKPLVEFCSQVLKTLPTPDDTGFHLEVFEREDEIIFCEIASRIASPWMNEMWIQGLNFNLKKEFIRAQAGIPTTYIKPENPLIQVSGGIIFPAQEGKVIKCSNNCPFEWVTSYTLNIQLDDILAKPTDMLEPVALMTLTAANTEQIKTRFLELIKWFNQETHIEKPL